MSPPLSAAEIRRLNYTQVVDQAGGVVAFCKKYEKYDVNADYVRQLMNGPGKKSGRNIGDRSARKIEAMLGKERNWMDQLHGPVGIESPLGKPAKSPDADFKEAQQDNSMHAIRIALLALFADMASNRSDEAERVAAGIREQIPDNFQDRGLMRTLLGVLDKGVKVRRATARKRARPGAKPPTRA